MTDEERQKLCEKLRDPRWSGTLESKAADEIEQLSKRIEELEKDLARMETDLNLAVYTD